ncbi:energy transducer TonB [Edaphobacter sp. HDX4]|uniref:energy transducer TonB n=1 Tax=Edaphobacter sp. HDX4 TaxID=2794064 RepID=UPI002FE69487
MFEEGMVESLLAPVSTTRRWTMAGSIVVQALIALALAALPLLHPEKLIFHAATPLVFTPPPPRPPVQRNAPVGPAPVTSYSAPAPIQVLIPGSWRRSGVSADLAPALMPMGTAVDGSLPAAITSGPASNPAVSIVRSSASSKPVRISSGVSAGMLLSPLHPVYPAIARATRTSGTVVVEALISKSGTVERLHVVSGPELLRTAALDAIRTARYRPFLLNGDPTEVQTTITVNFTLGG